MAGLPAQLRHLRGRTALVDDCVVGEAEPTDELEMLGHHAMRHWNEGMGNWASGGWIVMIIMMLVLVVIVVWAVVTLTRHNSLHDAARPTHAQTVSQAQNILDERFARGEIDEDEYRRRRSALQAPRS